jgi:hypothetical protein
MRLDTKIDRQTARETDWLTDCWLQCDFHQTIIVRTVIVPETSVTFQQLTAIDAFWDFTPHSCTQNRCFREHVTPIISFQIEGFL